MKRTKVHIYPSKGKEFEFGNCAVLAIAGAFEVEYKVIAMAARILGMNYEEGLDWWECKKLINYITGTNIKYKSNGGITILQMAYLFNEGTYLVDTGEHLSLLQDGVIFDSYILENYKEIDIIRIMPTGWWRIS